MFQLEESPQDYCQIHLNRRYFFSNLRNFHKRPYIPNAEYTANGPCRPDQYELLNLCSPPSFESWAKALLTYETLTGSDIEDLINKHSLLEKELSSGKTEKKQFEEF